ncbi:MAG: tyrosine--tRNA ligase [Actinomycetota bacterium]|nr:tyrosine--tRNA ligase [Actinomycetota bacterium]
MSEQSTPSEVERQLSDLSRTIDDVITFDELRPRLGCGRPLRIKYGVDVTAPFLHIGHAVNLWMMRCLQEWGHVVVFLIGDFTTRIGDPTGKTEARAIPNRVEIEQNAERFIEQVGAVLLTDHEVFEVRRNSEWYEGMSLDEFLSLASMVTHARLIERDMFQQRIASRREIHVHELLYPMRQGYDSYMLGSGLTIVGTGQLFNELMERFYQERFGQSPRVVVTTKITPGIDGKQKQSKSLGNYIALADTPRDKFGKTMSIPDELILPYFEVYTEETLEDVDEFLFGHPMEAKKRLAEAVVARYHGDDVARAERE